MYCHSYDILVYQTISSFIFSIIGDCTHITEEYCYRVTYLSITAFIKLACRPNNTIVSNSKPPMVFILLRNNQCHDKQAVFLSILFGANGINLFQ